MSFPGPKAMHLSDLSSHLEVSLLQGSPDPIQIGSLMFGETSPRFADANAPTKSPFPTNLLVKEKLVKHKFSNYFLNLLWIIFLFQKH